MLLFRMRKVRLKVLLRRGTPCALALRNENSAHSARKWQINMNDRITYAVFTDKGDREINEDSVGVCQGEAGCCFVLCDGLGGHGMGDVASSLAVEVFKDQFAKSDDAVNFLGQAFRASQDIIMAEQAARNARKRMKTTCVCIAADDRNAYVGHVGDSRGYVFFKNKVRTRTVDHSIPQMLAITGEIKESQIRNHPDRNILLRVLGVEWEEDMHELMAPIPLKKCQAFLLCSDGFWELIEESEMCRLLKKANSADEWLSAMAQIVKENGKNRNMDNYSAIAVWL